MAYDIAKLGIRIAEMRRERSWTQERLSQELGVSPQAISKWETGIGCPDISLLPTIAEVFGVTINDLFSEETAYSEKVASHTVPFPPELGNLKLVASHEHKACYADIPGSLDGLTVRFPDGSEADFEEMVVINRGKGTILLRTDGDFDLENWERKNGSADQHQKTDSSHTIDSLSLDLSGPCNISIQPSENGKTSWSADGPSAFMSHLTIEEKGSTLSVKVRDYHRGKLFGMEFGSRQSGNLRFSVAQPQLKSLTAKIGSASDLTGSIAVEDATISLAGSGDVTLGDISALKLKVAGSGDCSFEKVGEATISIAGSGDVKLKGLTKKGDIRIAGSGDVSIFEGDVETLDISIIGSGDIDARHVTVNELNIEMMGTGAAVIGRVRGHSVERISRTSDLKILRRD